MGGGLPHTHTHTHTHTHRQTHTHWGKCWELTFILFQCTENIYGSVF